MKCNYYFLFRNVHVEVLLNTQFAYDMQLPATDFPGPQCPALSQQEQSGSMAYFTVRICQYYKASLIFVLLLTADIYYPSVSRGLTIVYFLVIYCTKSEFVLVGGGRKCLGAGGVGHTIQSGSCAVHSLLH